MRILANVRRALARTQPAPQLLQLPFLRNKLSLSPLQKNTPAHPGVAVLLLLINARTIAATAAAVCARTLCDHAKRGRRHWLDLSGSPGKRYER